MPWLWPLRPQPNRAFYGGLKSPTPDIFNFIGWDFGTHPIILHLRTRTEGGIQPSTVPKLKTVLLGIALSNTVHIVHVSSNFPSVSFSFSVSVPSGFSRFCATNFSNSFYRMSPRVHYLMGEPLPYHISSSVLIAVLRIRKR